MRIENLNINQYVGQGASNYGMGHYQNININSGLAEIQRQLKEDEWLRQIEHKPQIGEQKK